MAVTMAVHIRPGQGHAMSKQQVLRLLYFCSPNLVSQESSTAQNAKALLRVYLRQTFTTFPDVGRDAQQLRSVYLAPYYVERIGVQTKQSSSQAQALDQVSFCFPLLHVII